MGVGRLLPIRLQMRLVTPTLVLILPRSASLARDPLFFFLDFFSCRYRVRLGHRALASFLRAIARAEACSPQRFREESCVREIYLTLLSLATSIRVSFKSILVVMNMR